MELLTQTEFARRVGVSRQRISQLVDAGRLPAVAAGRRGQRKVPWAEGRIIWESDHAMHTGQVAPAEPPQQQGAEPADALAAPVGPMDVTRAASAYAQGRAMDKIAQAKTRQLKLEQLRGTLVERTAVEADAEHVCLVIRTTLQGLPSKLAPRLESQPTAAIETILAEEIEQALAALHDSRFTT